MMGTVDLRQLEYLVAVADHGSFTEAAVGLGVTQPSVSQGMRALENEVGALLLNRLPGGAKLTAAGRALYPHALSAVRDAAAGRSAVDAVRGLEAGTLDLVCLPTLAANPLGRLVGGLRIAHPGVTVRIAHPETVDDLVDRIRDGRSEVGITDLDREFDGLVVRHLEQQDFVALVPSGAAPATVTPAVLAGMPIITSPKGTSTRRQLDELFAQLNRAPNVVVETEHRDAFAPLVAAGAGVAVVLRPLHPPDRDSGVAVAELRPARRRRIGLIHRSDHLAPAAQAFVDLAVGAASRSRGRPAARRRGGRRSSGD